MFHLPRSILHALFIAIVIAFCTPNVEAAESDALAISANIRQIHMPYGTVLDPIFASPDPASPEYSRIIGYSRAGDSAIWTGHFLAAESYRYSVTRSPDALENVWQALRGIRSLLDITGTNLLARCLVPTDSPFAAGIQQAEAGHGIYYNSLGGTNYFWIGNTSRDQYAGVMFGLGTAFDLVEEPAVRDFIRQDVTRILNFLIRRNWNVVMPNGTISTTFKVRPDQQLSFLQIGRRVDPQTFGPIYSSQRSSNASLVYLPIAYDNLDPHNHYFKFNLNFITFSTLIRLEEDGTFKQTYLDAYSALRRRTQSHGNAHFNMIDRALTGPNSARDAETLMLLDLWLKRPRRDYWVDLRAIYPACDQEDRACDPIPLDQRVNTDFLWQRSPFLLYGGGSGTIETAGVDYILTYWMARYYGLN